MSKEDFPTNPTSGRGLVSKKVRSDNEGALERARQIEEPWYRAQALASVARYAPDGNVERLGRESLDAAFEQRDPYNVVAVSAWPVRALIERQEKRAVEQAIPRLLALSEQIAHPVSRLEALFLLWQAVYPLAGEMRRRAQDRFVAACMAADSWKAADRLSWASTIVAADDRDEGVRLANLLREGRYKRRALGRIEAGRTERVRSFFT